MPVALVWSNGDIREAGKHSLVAAAERTGGDWTPMRVILGLGGNLGDPPATFRQAVEVLARRHRLAATSGLYRTEPVGPPQPRYWNAALLVETACPLIELLEQCQELEAAAGRRRGVRWGPRPLDLDLLVGDGVVHRGPRLTLPHRRLHERAFALLPAAELAPAWSHQLLGLSLAELAERIDRSGVTAAAQW